MDAKALAELGLTLGIDLRTAPVETTAATMQRLDPRMRGRVMQQLSQLQRSTDTATDESTRVIFAKTLVSLLPSSFQLLRGILAQTPNDEIAELHFSIFVFLGDAHQWLGEHDRSEIAHGLAEEYLMSVCTSAGQSAWMAGDMLGDHWPLEEALPILFRAVREAKCEAGREGALHGLAHALDRSPKALQWDIMKQLQATAASDKSDSVKGYAQSIIGPLRGM